MAGDESIQAASKAPLRTVLVEDVEADAELMLRMRSACVRTERPYTPVTISG